MVYTGMDIGTDKPDVPTRTRIPHHLIDIRPPEETYSAGAFATDAMAAIREIASRNRIALIVGGTLLYLRALRDGLSELPGGDADVRKTIDAEAKERGWSALHADLARVDPPAGARIGPTDRQRIQRALEVFRITGRTLTELQAAQSPRPGIEIPAVALVPSDRAALRDQIARRFDEMVQAGFVDEVRALRSRPRLSAQTPSMRSVGYRQIWAWLEDEADWEEARLRSIVATRQLAKRQLTWLRSDDASVKLSPADHGLVSRLRSEVSARLGL